MEKMPIYSQPEKLLEQKPAKEKLLPEITQEKKIEVTPKKKERLSENLKEKIIPPKTETKLEPIPKTQPPDSIEKEKKKIPEIFEVDKKTNEYVDERGNVYGTLYHCSKILGVLRDSLKKHIQDVNFIKGRDKTNRVRLLYNPEEIKSKIYNFNKSLPQINKETGEYVNEKGEIYTTFNSFVKTKGIGYQSFQKQIEGVPFIKGRDKSGFPRLLYKKSGLEDKLQKLLAMPKINKETGEYVNEKGEIYTTICRLTKDFGISRALVDKYKGDASFIKVIDPLGRISFFYSKKELQDKIKNYLKLPIVDEKTHEYIDKKGKVFVTISHLSEKFGLNESSVKTRLGNTPFIVGRGGGGHINKLYDKTKFKEEIKRFLESPRVDINTNEYTDKNGEIYGVIYHFARKFHIDIDYEILKGKVPSNLKFIEGRDRGGKMAKLYSESELLKALEKSAYFVRRGKVEKQKEKEKAELNLKNFVEEVSQGETLRSQEFRQLVNLFGGSRAIDLLYKYRPEYSGIPVEYVKKILADYLGDFLVEKKFFNIEDVKIGLKYLSDKNLKDDLFELIKDSGINFYNEKRKSGVTKNHFEIIKDYIGYIKSRTSDFRNKDIGEIIDKTEEYYLSLEKLKKPENLIDSLRKDRSFPDFYQLINIKEIADKKKELIADEMGIGKSASAILAKEYLGLKQALIIAPSNVLNTWVNYLSDKVSNKGEQIGYFLKGKAPKVLIIEDQNSLDKIKKSFYDYILISQEKLKGNYVKGLWGLNYDLLIIDEVHKLKNIAEGKRARNILELADRIKQDNQYLVLLSGTPVPNHITDIAIILKLLYPEKFENMENKQLVKSILYGDELDLRSLLMRHAQMKNLKDLGESIRMPRLSEEIKEIELSPEEKEAYGVLMEEDEISASNKIKILRQFLLNPELLDPTPVMRSSKIETLSEELNEAFKEKNKVVVFVNGYIENVIRGKKSIIDKLKLPKDIAVIAIEAETPKEKREQIQRELKESDKKILLLISGQTADVGVDFSGGERLYFYNEPWTKYDFKQQLARVYRPGLEKDLKSSILLVKNTIEEGIHHYIEMKERAIEKLLSNVPRTDIENKLLEISKIQKDPNLEVNPKLAEYYFSSWDRMNKIFSYIKELGEEDFKKFVSEFGRAYADCYLDLGSRSYQTNASRISGTMLNSLIKDRKENPRNLKILDIASGPEMLKKHIKEDYQDQIISIDINEYHFRGKGKRRVVASFSKLPFKDSSFNYVNFSLALHYTKFLPGRKEYERIKVLAEMNRVLKTGGRAVLNLIYSLDLKDERKFRKIAKILGFDVLNNNSGKISGGDNYESRLITLEKKRNINLDEKAIIKRVGKENFEGLKFINTGIKLKNSRKIIEEFNINKKKLKVYFNKKDFELLREEKKVLKITEGLKKQYKKIEKIPPDQIIANGFSRFFNGSKYILFKKLATGDGYVVYK